ncbi:MAG: DUF3084 domain-containing protein [Leptolyngbyaceae cyanobacterium]
MTTGYVLIFAVLILGGVIATLGDRIGMRVGKARLSLFRLRPRQTATVVSIMTGSVISASTLALLFGVSRQLRTGVFELEQIQSDLAEAKTELKDARTESATIEEDLIDAREQQQQAEQELQDINESLNQAVEEQRNTQTQLGQTQEQLTQLRTQLGTVSQQAGQLRSEIQRLEAERAELLKQQEAVQGQLAERDRRIAIRDREIAERQQTLSQLQSQQAMLQEEVASSERQLATLESQLSDLETQLADSERQIEGLRWGNVAVGRNEALISGLIQVSDGQEARQTVDQLLGEANRSAIQAIAPGTSLDRQVILIPQEEVTRLVNRIRDRQEYFVRIFSNANYTIGEPCVVANAGPCIRVSIYSAPNEIIYDSGERLATVRVDPRTLTNQDLVEQLNLLIASLQFRARQDSFVGNTIEIANDRTELVAAFLDEVRDSSEPVEIQAIAAEPIYPSTTTLRVELQAVSGREIIARTDELLPPLEQEDNEPDPEIEQDDPRRDPGPRE